VCSSEGGDLRATGGGQVETAARVCDAGPVRSAGDTAEEITSRGLQSDSGSVRFIGVRRGEGRRRPPTARRGNGGDFPAEEANLLSRHLISGQVECPAAADPRARR
jgi:hypothetical protein